MKALAVLPYLDQRLADESIGSLDDGRVDVLTVDNTVVNRGVTAPWATAANLVRAPDTAYDWLIIWSTAIVFGPAGGKDFCDVLDDAPWYEQWPYPRLVSGIGCGWHLTAIHWQVLQRVGTFDDAAFFAYCEDSDWIYRHRLAGLGDLWTDGHTQVPVDISVNRGDAHSIGRGLVQPDLGASERAYVRKWGGTPQHERFTVPYNVRSFDWRYVGPPPGGTGA